MKHPICWLLGHDPEHYSYTMNESTEVDYFECTRCNARKNLSDHGWVEEE